MTPLPDALRHVQDHTTKEEEIMLAGVMLVFVLLAILLIDLLALLRAADSRDGMESEEWELRRLWRTMP
jgi:hypothetical protein